MIFFFFILLIFLDVARPDCDFKNFEQESLLNILPQFVDKVDSCSESVKT